MRAYSPHPGRPEEIRHVQIYVHGLDPARCPRHYRRDHRHRLAWPGPTALVLVLVVAVWAVTGGFLEIFAAFADGETAGPRALYIVAGLVSVVFGLVLFARPGVGAITL